MSIFRIFSGALRVFLGVLRVSSEISDGFLRFFWMIF